MITSTDNTSSGNSPILLTYQNKTYTFRHQRSFLHFRWLLYRKFNVHPSDQILICGGKIIRQFPSDNGERIEMVLYKKLLGGIDGGVGNMLLALGGSLGLYYIGIFVLFFFLELLALRNPNGTQNNTDPHWFNNYSLNRSNNGKRCSLEGMLAGNNSPLLMLYLFVGFFFWVSYSSNLTIFINQYVNSGESNIVELLSIFVWIPLYLGSIILLYNIANNLGYDKWITRFINKYSILIFCLIMIKFIALIYLIYINGMDFNPVVYWSGQFVTTVILMMTYFYLVVGSGSGFSYWTLFLGLPLLGAIPYTVFYILQYLEIFHK